MLDPRRELEDLRVEGDLARQRAAVEVADHAPRGERQRPAERVADGGHAVAELRIRRRARRRPAGPRHPRHADVDEPAGRGLVDVGVERAAVPGVELEHRGALQDVAVGDDRVRVDREARAGGHAGAGDVAHAQRHLLGRAGHAVARELLRRSSRSVRRAIRVERLDRRAACSRRLRRDAEAQHGDRGADEHDRDQREDAEPAAHPPNCAWKAAKSVWPPRRTSRSRSRRWRRPTRSPRPRSG